MIHGHEEKTCNTDFRTSGGEIQCPCLCSFFMPKRPNQKYATSSCRYRLRDRVRYERNKDAVDLAKKILSTLGPKGGR